MQLLSRLEQEKRLDKLVAAGQRAARLIRPGKVRDGLNGVWLGHPVHPMLVQAPVGVWLSASMVDLFGDQRSARRLAAAGLAAAVPAAVAGTADWSEQHEQQMRVGVVHAAANLAAMSVREVRRVLPCPSCADVGSHRAQTDRLAKWGSGWVR